jgi:hypothetical protein
VAYFILLKVARGGGYRLGGVKYTAANIGKPVVVTVVANPEDFAWIAAQCDAISMAIDPAFLVLVSLNRQLVFRDPLEIEAVVVVHKMSVKGFKLLIILSLVGLGGGFGSFRSSSGGMLAAFGWRDDGVFSARLPNSRFERGGLGCAHQGLKSVRGRWWRRRRADADGLAGGAFGTLVGARGARRSAFFRGFSGGFGQHNSDSDKAEITTPKGQRLIEDEGFST